MLGLDDVQVTYGGVIIALDNVSLRVTEQGMVGLFGRNGAGKTTTLKAISGLLKSEEGEITRGTIFFENERIDRKHPEEIVKAGIVQVMEGRRIFEHFTVFDNLRAGAYLRSDRSSVKEDLEKIYNYFPQLSLLQNNVSGYLSGGEQQMLVIGRALMARPKIILFDEPSLGLAPLVVRNIFGIIKRIREEERTSVLLVEQNVKVSLSLVDYAYVMENGRVVLEGKADTLEGDPRVREFYLHGAGEETGGYMASKSYTRRERWLPRLG